MKALRFLSMLLLAMLLTAPSALAETDGDCLYTLLGPDGQPLTRRGGRMYVGDEYISGDDQLYRIVSVDDAAMTATAEHLGSAAVDTAALAAFMTRSALAENAKTESADDGKRLICMYSTHSDESYTPSDGDYSKWENAGIYDVGNALKEALESRGIEVIYSEESFLPHDADAYNRSRSTAAQLLKTGPDALLDVHRDAVPADEYETTIDGEDVSKVRLFVGRSNQNQAANEAFAQQIKQAADEEYPGLIKDIYIGKGNYNQELYPHALLLEMGTDEIEKDKVIESTKYLADVLDQVLYGGSAQASEKASAKPAATGILWAVGLAILGAIIYAVASTGGFSSAWDKLKRGASEITGGAVGKKPKK